MSEEDSRTSHSSQSDDCYIVDDITIKDEPIEPIDLSSDSEELVHSNVLSESEEKCLEESANAAIAAWLNTLSDEEVQSEDKCLEDSADAAIAAWLETLSEEEDEHEREGEHKRTVEEEACEQHGPVVVASWSLDDSPTGGLQTGEDTQEDVEDRTGKQERKRKKEEEEDSEDIQFLVEVKRKAV